MKDYRSLDKQKSKPTPTHTNLERKEILSLEEVLPLVVHNNIKVKKDIKGDLIKMNSLRYQLFATKGVCCVSCGLQGQYFAKEKHSHDKSFHLNLYGIKDGVETLLTKDHIKPKSLGGADNLNNLQTMCKVCNELKSNYFE